MDPITLEVINNSFQSVAEEMGAVLIRTAMSPNIKDRRDCSTAIYSPGGLLVAQAEHIPLHLGLMPSVVKAVLEVIPLSSMAQGDCVIINDPYLSGSHLPDICLITPIYHSGRPLAIVANLAHHVDVGGSVAGSMSTTSREIFQEGLRIPPVKIVKKGQIDRELFALISSNIRTAEVFEGDFKAQLCANSTAAIRLCDLASKYGPDRLFSFMNEIMNYSDRRIRICLSEMPLGVHSFEDFLEGDGISIDQLRIKVTATCSGDSLTVDFTGTDPQVAGPVNATMGVTLACVYFAVKSALDPQAPSNDGLSRSIRVITPPGSLVNPVFPAPVAHANINTAQRIADAVLGCLAGFMPQRVPAAGTGSMSNFTIGGINPESGSYYSYVETYGGGQGAKPFADGMDGVHVNMTNTMNTPVEVIEMNYPLLVNRYSLAPDSGGAGKYRGGLGIERSITVLGEKATVSVSTERVKRSPWGLAGGCSGKSATLVIDTPCPETGEAIAGQIRNGKFTGVLEAGSTIRLTTAGGGGYGPPGERDPKAVERDCREGYISKSHAVLFYGKDPEKNRD